MHVASKRKLLDQGNDLRGYDAGTQRRALVAIRDRFTKRVSGFALLQFLKTL
jgi:hypothetical protein